MYFRFNLLKTISKNRSESLNFIKQGYIPNNYHYKKDSNTEFVASKLYLKYQ